MATMWVNSLESSSKAYGSLQVWIRVVRSIIPEDAGERARNVGDRIAFCTDMRIESVEIDWLR